ncbi:UNVERIFIED_CONTAM: hypothetical protein RMT77_018509 [Armadillidium vulgare]
MELELRWEKRSYLTALILDPILEELDFRERMQIFTTINNKITLGMDIALEREKEKALERQKERAHKIRIMEIRLGIVSKFDKNIEESRGEKNKSADRVRKLEEENELKIELADPKQEKAVLPSISGCELSRQITSSRESPMKGENVFPQRKVSDEKETSPSQDLLFQPETFAEREATLSRDMSIPPALSKQEENEDEVFSSSTEIEYGGIPIPNWERIYMRENEERVCFVKKTISSEKESEINDFKISHQPEPKEENSIESSNIAVVSESVYENEDKKVETSSYLSFSSSSSSSLSFSSSFSNSVEENKTKSKKKRKRNHRKKKRKEDDENNYEGSNILNYKNDRRTASKRSIIQALGSNCPNRVKFAEDSSTCNIGSSPEFKESVQGASSNKQGKDGSERGKEQKTAPSQTTKNIIILFNDLRKRMKYKMLEESDDSHSKTFKFSITVGWQCLEGKGSKKKLSKVVAAKEALSKLLGLMDLRHASLTSYPNVYMPQNLADKIAKSVCEKFLPLTSENPTPAHRKIQRTRQYQ